MPTSETILVTGASGKLGQSVIQNLIGTYHIPASQIIATTRKPETLSTLAAKGVVIRAADFDDEATLVKAFSGAKRLLLISTDALDRPGRRLAQHERTVSAAKRLASPISFIPQCRSQLKIRQFHSLEIIAELRRPL